MNNSRVLFRVVLEWRQKAVNPLRNFHSHLALGQMQYVHNPDIDTSLFFTNLPNRRRERKVKEKLYDNCHGSLVISCKREDLNHYSGTKPPKFENIPLASKGWRHRKAMGDYFSILPKEYSPFDTKEELPETFEDCGLTAPIIDQLKKKNITYPTVIQAKVIKKLLTGENTIMFSESGSGKTLAYIVATVENILKWKDKAPKGKLNAPLGIIITSSKELAMQIAVITRSLCEDLGLSCHALIEGDSNSLMENPDVRPVDILVTTRKATKLLLPNIYYTNYCKHVVIDDVDTRPFTDHFGSVRRVLNQLNLTGLNAANITLNSAQICLVGTLFTKKVEDLLTKILPNEPIFSTNYLNKFLHTARQDFFRLNNTRRVGKLLEVVKRNEKANEPTLIFSTFSKTSVWVSKFLEESGIKCSAVCHNTMPALRMEMYRNFQSGFINFLSTTDDFSAGYNFPKVKHIINFEFPDDMSDYVHRCGRVGRLDQSRDSVITNLITARHIPIVNSIELAVRANIPLLRIGNTIEFV